jgi:hypothetical protein
VTQTAKIYPTIRAARNALALDTGFDPFLSGGAWGRPTKAKLAAAGYVVDPAACKREQLERARRIAEGLCEVCGRTALRRLLCGAHGVGNCPRCPDESTRRCAAHEVYSHQCDNGHRWSGGRDDFTCPKCGEYSV